MIAATIAAANGRSAFNVRVDISRPRGSEMISLNAPAVKI